ncbi:MAG TPA: hypothetical protein DCQ06_04005, partial [Myxococcales bacterium]|nr:hypothetical protein [Myxococcales bacterium]
MRIDFNTIWKGNRKMTGMRLVAALLVVFTMFGCEEYFTNAGPDASDGQAVDGGAAVDSSLFNGAGIGQACGDDEPCRSGLTCGSAGTCTPSGAKEANDACILSAECKDALQCGFFGFCVVSGDRPEGATCTSVSDCVKGLYCDLKGVSGFCAAPDDDAADLYGSCKSTAGCLPGLHCTAKGQCMPGSVTLSTELFPGSTCPVKQEEAMAFQARSRIPRSDAAIHGFYSTPFPTDLRRSDDGSKIDISEHPRPGPGLIGLDLIGNVVDAVGMEMNGFSVAPTVYIRWTRPLDKGSLVKSGPQQNIFFVNLKTGEAVDFSFDFKAARNKYICANWLAIHPTWRRALDPVTTYGVFVTDGVRADLPDSEQAADKIPVQGDDLALLLSSSEPSDPVERLAWQRFSPLRSRLASQKVAIAKVMAATVFTTQDPTRFMRQFRQVATAKQTPMPAPQNNAFHHCGVSKGKSPCATVNYSGSGSDPRDCKSNAASKPFHEYHFKLNLPVYQKGGRPYLDGGGQLVLESGQVQAKGQEWVCATLTIPKQIMPAAGWPVVLYSHGTGGSHRSGAAQMSTQLAGLKDGSTAAPVALLGIDGMMHGSRRGEIANSLNLNPGPLFYNFANPPAAKGNFYQGAADNFALIRFAKQAKLQLPSIGGQVRFNTAKIIYMGHSQGGTTGPLFAPYAHGADGKSDIASYVFSGAGAGLVFSLLFKKSPEDATIGIQLALQELDLDEYHPALALFQYYFDEVDPLSYAHHFYEKPVDNSQPLHVLHTYGVGDTYTPPETSRVFAAATGGLLLRPEKAGDWFDIIGDLGMKVQNHTSTVSTNVVGAFAGKKYQATGVTVEHLNDAAVSTNGKP